MLVIMFASKRIIVPENTKNTQDIFSPLKLFNFMCRILMTAPYVISGTVQDRKLYTYKNTDIFYIFRCLAILFLGFYSLHLYVKKAVLLRLLQAIFNILSITIIIIWTFIKKKDAIEMLKKFISKEREFNENKIHVSYIKMLIVSLLELAIIILIATATFYIVTQEFPTSQQILLLSLYIIPNAIIMAYICQFINYILILNYWLKSLNKYLENTLNNFHDVEHRMIIARKTYISIWKLSKRVQKYYQFPVLCIKATSFLNTTAFLYLWLSTDRVLYSTYIWIFANVLKIFSLPFVAEFCSEKEGEIAATLRQIVALKLEMSDKLGCIVDYAMQLTHNKIEFIVCGMFKMDFEFIFDTMAAVTIYVVIFKQNNVKSE